MTSTSSDGELWRAAPKARAGWVLGGLALVVGCGHGGAPPPREAATSTTPPPAAQDHAAASPREPKQVLEAEWKEVEVRTRKQGKELTAAVELKAPNIHLFHAGASQEGGGGEAGRKEGGPKTGGSASGPIDLGAELRKITPLDVDHIDVLDGQVTFVDVSLPGQPALWLHDVQMSVENLATRVHLTDGRPALLTATGTLGKSGKVSIFVAADPFEKGLTFSGRASLVGLRASELYGFLKPAANLQAPHGTIDVFIEFDCRNGALTGGVKPVLKNVTVRPAGGSPWATLEAWASDLALDIFSDRVPGRNAVATVLPIKGSLTSPDLQLWPTILGVLRNAFVEGVTSGYGYLPPETAKQQQGVVEQGVDALTGSQPPKAQPTPAPDAAAPSPPPPPRTPSGQPVPPVTPHQP